MRFRDKIIRLFRRIPISGLMNYVVATMAIFFVLDMVLYTRGFISYNLFCFDRSQILQGQVWRIFTFIFLPPTSSLFWILFSLLFYWLIGTTLERTWGRAEFFAYYAVGSILSIIGGFISGYADNLFLNYSLFFAYATLFPYEEFRLYFIISVPAKWLAIIDAVFMGLLFLLGDFSDRIGVIMSVATYLIFFGPEFFSPILNRFKHKKFYKYMKKNK